MKIGTTITWRLAAVCNCASRALCFESDVAHPQTKTRVSNTGKMIRGFKEPMFMALKQWRIESAAARELPQKRAKREWSMTAAVAATNHSGC